MKARAPRITETQEHKAIAAYFRKIGLGPGALAIHIRNENGSAWERMMGKTMGVMSGVPDWLILSNGDAGFIELKPRGFKEKLSRGVGITPHVARQLKTQTQLRDAGGWVEICETLEDVLATLQRHGVPLRAESKSTELIRRAMTNVFGERSDDS